jgi:7-carboxy-7-deazaguanine synthase
MCLDINEMFLSIQGESTFAGLPCIFIRLAGCNLACRYCDTLYAAHVEERIAIDAVLRRIEAFGRRRVEITGGEPLLQPETPRLVKELLDNGYEVLLETNGSMNIDCVDPRSVRIVDVKCPSSGEWQKMDSENLARLTAKDQVKFVLSDRQDFDFALDVLPRLPAHVGAGHILFSPVWERLSPAELASWILGAGVDVRLHLQLHKWIWPGVERGV